MENFFAKLIDRGGATAIFGYSLFIVISIVGIFLVFVVGMALSAWISAGLAWLFYYLALFLHWVETLLPMPPMPPPV